MQEKVNAENSSIEKETHEEGHRCNCCHKVFECWEVHHFEDVERHWCYDCLDSRKYTY